MLDFISQRGIEGAVDYIGLLRVVSESCEFVLAANRGVEVASCGGGVE